MKERLLYYCINHIYPLSIFFLLILPSWCMANANIAATTQPLPQKSDDEQPVLSGAHYGIICFENNLPTVSNTPELNNVDPKFNYQLRYEDHNYDLTQTTGFSGYFDLARWQKNYGDGGVDVTGAPNVALVEGTNAALVKLMDQQPVMLEIDVPVEGYVRFDWRKIGGSYFSLEIKAGSQRFYLEEGRNGHYISPLLKAGDQLRLTFSNTQDVAASSAITLENFHFYTNAVQVIAREWQAIRKASNLASFTQFISVEPLDLEEVIFPIARNITDAGAIYDPASLHPEVMGFPYIDRDGNLQTTEDRYYLESSNCAFTISWEDELIFEENHWTLLRRWQVADLISKNVLEKTQEIKLYSDASLAFPKEETNERANFDFQTVFRPRAAIQYLEWQAPNE